MFSFFHTKTNRNNLEWLGADIHSGLLSAIAGETTGLADTIAYIRALDAVGIHKIFCTPVLTRSNYQQCKPEIDAVKEKLDLAIHRAGINCSLITAAKYQIDEKFHVENEMLTLPGRYIFIELPAEKEPRHLEEIIFDLQIFGYTVILSGPERYTYYQQQHHRYARLKELGVHFQLHLMSIMGHYGKAAKHTGDYLLNKKHYDLAGTEAENENHLALLLKNVIDGAMFQKTRNYPFKNNHLFG